MLEKERKFAALVNKGQQSFDNKEWNTAIGYWNEALQIKPDHKELEKQISAARQEIEQEASRKATELQNERAYKLLLASADSMFHAKQYKEAKDKYTTATRLNDKDVYPANKIQEINSILTALAKQETAKLKQEEEKNIAYQKAINIANQAFTAKEYTKAIGVYKQASDIKTNETYPKEMIAKAEQALAELKNKKPQKPNKNGWNLKELII